MTNAAIATDFYKSFNVKCCVSTKVTFNGEVVGDVVTELFNIVFC